MAERNASLDLLAERHGIATHYQDGLKQRRMPPHETVLALLQALDVPINSASNHQPPPIEPVVVAWDGKPPPGLKSEEATLPYGRHRMKLQRGEHQQEVWVISAPRTCPKVRGKHWGVFAPTYALHSKHSLGVGDLGDLSRLGSWLRERGGSTLATLPLCAAFLDEPLEISPYAPVSRLFWNELYLDLSALPELEQCSTARQLMESSAFQNEARALRVPEHVDHKRAMALKRRVLEPLALHSFSAEDRWSRLAAERPDVLEYARFVADKESDFDAGVRYHAYVQLAFESQLRNLQQGFDSGPGLYLDVPVGVHRDGFDAWKYPDAFLPNTAAGAPPDALFTGGQNWGFAPAHPQKIRETGYEYFYAYLSALARHAGVLRIDHVMGLHRIFAIPDGAEGKDGTYIHFHPEEQWAVLCLVAYQCGCLVVGEDLGTVPSAVRSAMEEHETLRMFVGLYSFADKKANLRSPQKSQVASLGTHDTPTLAGFLEGRDIDDRFKMGLLTEAQKKKEHLQRRQLCDALQKKYGKNVDRVHRGLLKALAQSDSPIVLATLEDCWGEPQPQNTPGTGADWANWANWKRRMTKSIEEVLRSDRVHKTSEILQR